jgi:hypothetical protein
MENISKTKNRKKILFIVLIVCFILIILHLAYFAKWNADNFRKLLANNIERYQKQAVELISAGIEERLLISAQGVTNLDYTVWIMPEKSKKQSKNMTRTGDEIVNLISRHPEIDEINLFNPEGNYLSIFTSAPSVEAHDGIAKFSRIFVDSLNYGKAYWDTTIYYAIGQKQIATIDYIFILMRKEAITIVEAINTEKLKPFIANLLIDAKAKGGVYPNYRLPNPLDEAEVKICDSQKSAFSIIGEHRKLGSGDDRYFNIRNTPWKALIRMSTAESRYLRYVYNGWYLLLEGMVAIVFFIIVLKKSKDCL